MSNESRVPRGVPAGGEFASHNRPADNISLTNTTSPTMAAANAAAMTLHEALRTQARANVAAIIEQAKAASEDFKTAYFETNAIGEEPGVLVFKGGVNASGDDIVIESKFRAEIRHLAENLRDPDYLLAAGFTKDMKYRDEWDRESWKIEIDTPTPAPTVEDLASELKNLDVIAAAADSRRFEIAASAIELIARERFPAAASVRLRNMNDGPGSPFFDVATIENAQGQTIHDAINTDPDLEAALGDYSPLLDRNLSALDRDASGDYRLIFRR